MTSKRIALLTLFSLQLLSPAMGTDAESETEPDRVSGCTSLVPVIPASGVRVGSVIRAGVFAADYPAYHAFDLSSSTIWLSELWQTPTWIGFDWSAGSRIVHRYEIRHQNGPTLTSRAPRDWTLQGSNDGGATWTVVDSRIGETGWFSGQTRGYDVASPGSFGTYRLRITDDNDIRPGNVVISIERIRLLDCSNSRT